VCKIKDYSKYKVQYFKKVQYLKLKTNEKLHKPLNFMELLSIEKSKLLFRNNL